MSEKWAPSISRKKWLKLRSALTFDAQFDEVKGTIEWFKNLIDEMESEHKNHKWVRDEG